MINDSNLTSSNKRAKKVVPTLSEINAFFEVLDIEVNKITGFDAPEGLEVINTSVYYAQIETIYEHGEFLALVGEKNYRSVAHAIGLELEKYEAAQSSIKNILDYKKAKKQIMEDLNAAKKFKVSLDKYTYEQVVEIDEVEFTKNDLIPKKYQMMTVLVDEYVDALSNFLETNSLNLDMIPIDKYMGSPKKTKTPLKNLIAKILKDYKIKNYSEEAKKLIDQL